MSKSPLISIGMPAYNAEAYIGLALEGLLTQTCGDFELIVSDNASTDGTRDVVESYRARDRRIRYERQPSNIGANLNYSRVAQLAEGEYFKWASSSDWCAPTFLDRCLLALRESPDAVLAVPRTRLFEGAPAVSREYEGDIDVIDETPSARFRTVMTTMALNNAINGLIRMPALRHSPLIRPYRGSDGVLMAHLALLGKFLLLDEALYFRRMEAATSTVLQDSAAVWRHHYPQPSARMLMQGSKRHLGYLRSVLSAPMSVAERIRTLALLARVFNWDRRALAEDLRGVWHYLSHRSLPGQTG